MEESMVSAGMANACNACHLDKSVNWALTAYEKHWGKSPTPKSSWPAYSTLDLPAMDVWSTSEDSHMRYLTTQWLANSQWASEMFATVAGSLNDSEPVNRVFAIFAISKILDRKPSEDFGVDITAGPEQRQRQIRALIEAVKSKLDHAD